MQRNRWRVLCWYPANMKLFRTPKERAPFAAEKVTAGATFEPMVALKLVRDGNAGYWSLQQQLRLYHLCMQSKPAQLVLPSVHRGFA